MPPYSKKDQARRAKSISVEEFRATQLSEADLQRQCEELLDLYRVLYLRIPEEVTSLCSPFYATKINQHVRNMISKYFKGWPDLTIFDKGRFLCVELKSAKGKQSQGQKTFEKKVAGYYRIVRSFEEFEHILKEFLK